MWLVGLGPDNISSVVASESALKFVGRWEYRNDVRLNIERHNDRIAIVPFENDTWRTTISNARIAGNSLHYVQKSYCKKMLLHPFSGVPCKCVLTLLDDYRLEYRLTTWFMPLTSPEILSKAE